PRRTRRKAGRAWSRSRSSRVRPSTRQRSTRIITFAVTSSTEWLRAATATRSRRPWRRRSRKLRPRTRARTSSISGASRLAGRNDRGRLDLDLGALLQQPNHQQRHGRKMTADDAAIGLADLALARDVSRLVGDVPIEPRDVLRARAGFGQHRHDILQRLLDLGDEVVAHEPGLRGPADLAGDGDVPARRGDAVGVALGRLPAGRVEKLKVGHAPRDPDLLLPQTKALDLAGRGLRQGVDEIDGARIFVWRDRRLHMVLEAFCTGGVGGDAGSHDNVSRDDLPALAVGLADDGAFSDLGV